MFLVIVTIPLLSRYVRVALSHVAFSVLTLKGLR